MTATPVISAATHTSMGSIILTPADAALLAQALLHEGRRSNGSRVVLLRQIPLGVW